MEIDEHGHFEFNNYLYVQGCNVVIENSIILGEVDMNLPLYRQWYEEYAKPLNIPDNILTWSVLFIPKLEYSVIKFQCAMIDNMES